MAQQLWIHQSADSHACPFGIQGRPYPMEKRPLSGGASSKVVQGGVKKTKVFFIYITCCLSRNCALQCWQDRCRPDRRKVYIGIHYKQHGQHGFRPVEMHFVRSIFKNCPPDQSQKLQQRRIVLKACTTISRSAPTGEHDDCKPGRHVNVPICRDL